MENKEKKKLAMKDLIEIILIFLIMYLVFQFILMSVRVSGPSMYPTYVDGERGIMIRTNPLNNPKHGDVVVIDGTAAYGQDEGFVVKRVIAMGNDTFEIKENTIYVNGKKIVDKHRNPDTFMEDYPKITLKEDEVFVLGDNRNVSKDSRKVGPIKINDIKAVHGIMYWPLNKIGVMQ